MTMVNSQQLLYDDLRKRIGQQPAAVVNIKENKPEKKASVTIMIGLDDKKNGITTIIAYDKEKTVLLARGAPTAQTETIEYNYKTQKMSRNKQPISNSPQNFILRLVREFEQRNKNVKVVKG